MSVSENRGKVLEEIIELSKAITNSLLKFVRDANRKLVSN